MLCWVSWQYSRPMHLSKSKLGTVIETFLADYFASSRYHIIGDSSFQLHKLMMPYKDTGCLTVKEINFNRNQTVTDETCC